MNDKVEKQPPVPPFVQFVASAVPMVFDNSMSYYEAICAMWKYLNDTVNVINNNATVTEEYIQITKDMKEYMDNYFDNLDVQEEINNKLDAMVEDGTLQEIITQYIQANVAWTFDTVADMKLSENLINGSYAQTLGFHTLNDGGGALYKITDSGTANEMNVIAIDTLYANLIIPSQLSVKQTGAYGDNTHDDTAEIQTALNISNNVIIPAGTYLIDAVTHLNINSNQTIKLDESAVLKAIPNDQTGYAVVNINNVSNVHISGGTIQGDKATHTGSTGEWGHCISVNNGSSNITIEKMRLIDAWGDGLYINGVTNLVTKDLWIENDRRNGISVISVDGYIAENTTIKDISGTAPEAGIDFEPNDAAGKLKNILVKNIHTINCAMGGVFALGYVDATSDRVDITIQGFTDNSSDDGIRLSKPAAATGRIVIDDITLLNNNVNPLAFRNFTSGSDFKCVCKDIYIYRTTADGTSTDFAAIRGYGAQTNGNIELRNIEIYQTGVNSTVDDIYIRDADDVSIINPIHKTNRVTITNDVNFHMSDPLFTYTHRSGSGAGYAGASDMRSRSIKDNTSGSDSSVSFTAQAPIGYYCQFININQTKNYTITLPASTYCRALSSEAAASIVLAPGASITLEKIDTYEIVPRGQSGTITVTT